MFSLIEFGLTSCAGGFGISRSRGPEYPSCQTLASDPDPSSHTWARRSYMPTGDAANATEVVSNLDVLLTGGRLSPHDRNVIEQAFQDTKDRCNAEVLFEPAIDEASLSERCTRAGLVVVEQLVSMTSDFQTTAGKQGPANPVKIPEVVQNPSHGRPYKATVYLFLAGGADSFNIL